MRLTDIGTKSTKFKFKFIPISSGPLPGPGLCVGSCELRVRVLAPRQVHRLTQEKGVHQFRFCLSSDMGMKLAYTKPFIPLHSVASAQKSDTHQKAKSVLQPDQH